MEVSFSKSVSKYSVDLFLELSKKKNYFVYREGAQSYNLNIVGWRSSELTADKFNDVIGVYWQQDTIWRSKFWPATTLPGKPWLLNPVTKKGTAILVPGQYAKAYSLGYYKGKAALRQIGSLKVYRDNNQNADFDRVPGSIEEGFFGIHIHRAGVWSKLVGTSSAGCQVFQRSTDFDEFIKLCQLSASIWGNSFTYTLFDEVL